MREVSPLIIAGAFAPELEPIRTLFSERDGVSFLETGVGLVEASISTTLYLERLKQDDRLTRETRLLFVGSAGSIDQNVDLDGVVCAKSVALVDSGQAAELSYFPEVMKRKIAASEHILETLSVAGNGRNAVYAEPVYSGLAISASKEVGLRLAEASGARFENMELFGVAAACEHTGMSWGACLPITNYISPEGHSQWSANHLAAAQRVAQFLAPL